MSFFSDSSLALLAGGGASKDGKLYSIKPTSGQGDFTFVRGGGLTATRVNDSGFIEKGRENLLLQSNNFGDTSAWSQLQATRNSGQSGYDSSTDAWEVVRNSGGAVVLTNSFPSSLSGVNTFSIYVKVNSSNGIGLAFGSPSVIARFNISDNLQTSAVSQGGLISSKQEYVGNDFYRLSITADTTSSDVRLYSLSADGTSSISTGATYVLQDAQTEIGLVATEYIETGAATAKAGLLENSPRFDYSGGVSCPSLLLEPTRTNLFKNSEYFDSGNYSLNNGFTITTNATTSPEGFDNASLFISANSTNEQYISVNSLSVTSGNQYTLSVFAKKKDFDFIQLRFSTGGGKFNAEGAWFNIDSGTLATVEGNLTASIEDYGNGWYRCMATATSIGTGSGASVVRVYLSSDDNVKNVTGDGTSGTYFYGAQFEEGSYATSYIPNYKSNTVGTERLFDDTNVLTYSDNFTSLLFYADITMKNVTRDTSGFNLRLRKAGGNIISIYRNSSSNSKRACVRIVNDLGSAILDQELSSDRVKIAVQYNSNNGSLKMYVNGTNALASSITDLNFDEFTDFDLSGESGAVNISQFIVIPTTYTNAELAAITTI